MKQHLASLTIVLAATTSPVLAQPVVDGSLDTAYGPALSIQNTNTGFGDSNDPDARTSAGGSELDGVFGKVDNGFLYLLFTGNLEDNFNKLEVFIDSQAGVGQNTLVGANLPVAVDAFCCGGFGTTGGALQTMNGLTFDADFAPDYYLTTANGSELTGNPIGFPIAQGYIATTHFAELNNGPGGANVRVGGVLDAFGDQFDATGVSRGLPLGTIIDQNNNLFGQTNPNDDIPLHEFFEPLDPIGDFNNERNHRDMDNTIGMLMAVNNSNAAASDGGDPPIWTAGGVIGNGNTNVTSPEFVALAGQVSTGFEYAIPLSTIGNPTGDIKITAFVNNSSHNYASNQFSGEGVLRGNLGGNGDGAFTGSLSGLDLSTIAGDQFVTIVPEPASLAVMLIGTLCLQRRRRR